MTIIMSAPLRRVYMVPETRPCRAANAGVVQLSWDLLVHESVEDKICSFFTDFMTTPERSGPFYISPHVYHTQITEYSLETIFRRQNSDSLRWALFSQIWISCFNRTFIARPSPFSPYNHILIADWSFKEHISRALPTEMIIYLLRSIYTLFLARDGTTESMINSLDIIVKWLEVSVLLWLMNPNLISNLCLGTWIWATERLIRSFPSCVCRRKVYARKPPINY